MGRVLSAVAALLVAAGVAAVAWWWLDREEQRTQARAAAEEFVAAWSDEDWVALDAVTVGEGAGSVHADAHEALEVTSAEIELAAIDLEDPSGPVPARYEARLVLDRLGVWSYVGAFVVEPRADEWRVAWHPGVFHADLDHGQRLERARTWPSRAPILGRQGRTLAGEGEVVSVGVEPREVTDREHLIEVVSAETPATEDDVAAVLDRDDLEPDWFYPIVAVPRDAYDDIADELATVPGVVAREETTRVAAAPEVAEVVGRVDGITAEQLDELPVWYEASDEAGRTGLEARFERELAGRPGGEVRVVDDGDIVTTLVDFDPVEPRPLETTLDPTIQEAAVASLEGEEREAAVVVLDARTSAVRGVVSRPAGGFPRAVAGRYPPGSVAKIVTAAALVDAGLAPGSAVDCPAEYVAGGREFRNAGGLSLGEVPLREAFAWSCNTTFIAEALHLGDGPLAEAAHGFGFGDSVGEGGYEVARETSVAAWPDPSSETEAAAQAIGQGRVLASPLHLASVAGAAVTGEWHRPHLLADDQGSGRTATTDPDVLTALMANVVEEGTGAAAAVDGVDVVGKTGTAEMGEAEHAWFVGVAPELDTSGLAFAVLVEGGGAGGETAAPIAANLVERLADLVP